MYPTLAVDTSHVSLVARAASRLQGNGSSQGRFRRLISLSRCGLSRALVTSTAIRDLELDLTDPSCPPRKYAELEPADLGSLGFVEATDGVVLTNPPEGVGDQDWSLLAISRQIAADGSGVILLSNDEALLNWAHDEFFFSGSELEVVPVHSLDFLGHMHTCGAIAFDELAEISEGERQHLESRLREGTLEEPLASVKIQRAKDVLNRAAMTEARRRQGRSYE